MKLFLTWLRQTFTSSRPESAAILRETRTRIDPGRPGKPPPVRQPKNRATKDSAAENSATGEFANTGLSGERPGKIVDGDPDKDVTTRSRYVWENTGTHDTLKILDDSLSQTDEEDGIDPYNTGQFDRSKSWDRLSRK